MDRIFLGQLINSDWRSAIKIKTLFFDILFINEVFIVYVLLSPYVAYFDCPLNIDEVSGLNSFLIERLI